MSRVLILLLLSATSLTACERKCGSATVEGVNLWVVDLAEKREPAYPIDGEYLLSCGAGRGDVGTPDHFIGISPEGASYVYPQATADFFIWPGRRNNNEDWAVGRVVSPLVRVDLARVDVGETVSLGDGILQATTDLNRIAVYPYTFQDEDGNRQAGELLVSQSATEGTMEFQEIRELTGCDDPFVEVRVRADYRFLFANDDGSVTTEVEGTTWFQFWDSTTAGIGEDAAIYCALEEGMGRG